MATAPVRSSQNSDNLLRRLSLESEQEALLCVPRDYLDCRGTEISRVTHPHSDRRIYRLSYQGGVVSRVQDRWVPGVQWRAKFVKVPFRDQANAVINWTLFGDVASARSLQPGQVVYLHSRIELFNGKPSLRDALIVPPHAAGRIWTRYAGISGRVSAESVQGLVEHAFSLPDAMLRSRTRILASLGGMTEKEALLKAYERCGKRFDSFDELLNALHTPSRVERGQEAQQVAKALSVIALQNAAYLANARLPVARACLPVSSIEAIALAEKQVEKLTANQIQAVAGIAQGLNSPKPLMALLSGDVGSGKTLTYLLPLVAAHLAGARCAIVAPTQILADQVAQQIVRRFGQSVRVARIRAGDPINDSSAILVGTVGLVNAAKRARYQPDVLVCDEQHKMATGARESMLAPWTHLIEVTATPIPRTMATALYGGMQVFCLEQPPVQRHIESHVMDVTQRPAVVSEIKRVLASGARAVVIYPAVDRAMDDEDGAPRSTSGGESKSSQTVVEAAHLLERHFAGQVAALHGQLSDEEKDQVIQRIRDGSTPLVVASTIFETGIDIPDIRLMVVRNAACFGISQLHQLRGRLARNGGAAHFVMMTEEPLDPDNPAYERLQAIRDHTNGFKLAELDMHQRGFGNIDEANQSGAMDGVFKLLRLSTNDFAQPSSDVTGLQVRNDRAVLEVDDESSGQQALFRQ